MDRGYLIWAEGRWIYWAIVADLHARQVVNYSVSDKASSHFVINALDMAWSLRSKAKSLMFHSDQGCQYLSAAFRHRLSHYGIVQNVSHCGNYWDNAPAERLFRSFAEANSDMFCYLFSYYN
jgi:putative transposase